MVGKSVSVPKARAVAKPHIATAVAKRVISKSIKGKAKKSEAELLKQIKKEEKEATNYAKGQARRAAEAKAARAKAYDEMQAMQNMLRSVFGGGDFVYRPEVPIVFPPEIQVTCPGCNHSLTQQEVMAGFRNDPLDFTTGCPKCETRFASVSIVKSAQDKLRFVWLCPPQTREAYAEWLERCKTQEREPTFEWLCHSAPQIAWNALRYGLNGDTGGRYAKLVVQEFLNMDK